MKNAMLEKAKEKFCVACCKMEKKAKVQSLVFAGADGSSFIWKWVKGMLLSQSWSQTENLLMNFLCANYILEGKSTVRVYFGLKSTKWQELDTVDLQSCCCKERNVYF